MELNYKPRIENETRRHKKKEGPAGEEFQNVAEWPYPCTDTG